MSNTGYLCLLIILRMVGVSVDSAKIENTFINSDDEGIAIIKAAKELGLKVKLTPLRFKKIQELNIPVIVRRDNDKYIVVLKANEKECIILDPEKKNPEKISADELMDSITGECIIIGKGRKAGDSDPIAGNSKIGFGWFIPTILKYKNSLSLFYFLSL